jgi:hypothetical protein
MAVPALPPGRVGEYGAIRNNLQHPFGESLIDFG